LAEADLVLYDALVQPAALDLAPRAQRFFVGKRAHRAAVHQDTIHRLMIRAARRGKRVVRLKGGDPFLLGRGGEEALALEEAGIPYEVVPGISSALAAPALAGIPVTHRGLSTSLVIVSGHEEAAWRPVLQALTPGSTTVVILMGMAARTLISTFLIDRGWKPSTPAAIALAASTPQASTWYGTLEDLGAVTLPGHRRVAPGVLVVGKTVSVGSALVSWSKAAGSAASQEQPAARRVNASRG
jgi:uroporphyrin-III C-methyltransferase/precorrin-2 dehydrogenase/sirohydrochlorin ferrochelatase